MTILSSILPIFLIIGTGTLLQKLLPKQPKSSKLMCKAGLGSCVSWTSVLNKFALYLALPALIIHSLITTNGQNIISADLVVFNIIALTAFLLLVYFACKATNASTKLINTYLFGAFFGNVAYIGYPFINNLFNGSSGVVSILIAMPMFFMIGFFIFSQSQNLTISILEAAMPVALTNFALAEIYEIDQHAMSSTIIISTIVSAITLLIFAIVLA